MSAHTATMAHSQEHYVKLIEQENELSVAAEELGRRLTVRPGGYCSPSHRMPFDSIPEGLKCVVNDVAGNIWLTLGDG